jgi:hypothetical protein
MWGVRGSQWANDRGERERDVPVPQAALFNRPVIHRIPVFYINIGDIIMGFQHGQGSPVGTRKKRGKKEEEKKRG